MRFVPGCYCCYGGGETDCLIGSDNFDDRSEVGDDWVADAGTWSVGSGLLTTSSTSARLRYATEHPDSVAEHIVEVEVKGGAGAKLRLWVGTTSTIDLWVELTIAADGNGTLTLNDGTGVLKSENVQGADDDIWHRLTLWYSSSSDRCVAEFFSGSVAETKLICAIPAPSISGTYVGVGTGSNASSATFDYFTYSHYMTATRPTCEEAPMCVYCTNCPESPALPETWTVRLENFTNKTLQDCPDCTPFNTSYILDLSYADISCEWFLSFTSFCGTGESTLELHVTDYIDGVLYIKVLFVQTNYCYYTWSGSIETTSCASVTNLELDYVAAESNHAGYDETGYECCVNASDPSTVRCYVTAA